MIRQSRERPFGELELFIRPLKRSINDTDSEDAYDNGFLNIIDKSSLEQSLEVLRDDLSTGHLIEQYEVRRFIVFIILKMKIRFFFSRFYNEEKKVLPLK